MKLLISLILFVGVLGQCTSPSKKEVPTRRMYIKYIRGAAAQPIDVTVSSATEKIPYNTPIEYVVNENKSYPNYGQVIIFWKGLKYSISREIFSHEENSQYFRVVTKSGLNLRTEPHLKSKVDAIIPFLATGKITTVGAETLQIQGRTGYWLRVAYQNKTGWIFSGFVLTGDSPEQATLQYHDIEIRSPELIPIGKEQIKTIVQQFPMQNNTRFIHFLKPDDECSAGSREKRSGMLFEDAKGIRRGLQGDKEVPVRTNIGAPNLFLTFYTMCFCCCPNSSDIIYLRQKNEMTPYYISLGKYEGSCDSFGPQRSTETRISADKTKVMLMAKSPICEGTYSESDSTQAFKNIEYFKGVFAIFDLSEGTLKKIETLSIPSAYNELWSQGFTLVKL